MSEPSYRVLPASRGLAWLMTAGVLMKQQTWRLLTVAIIIQLLLSFTQLPVIGLFLALALPIFSAGMLQCFDHVRRGLPLSPGVLFTPFSEKTIAMRLFLLGGLLTLIAFILISWLLSGVPELNDPELISQIEQGDIEAVLSLDPSVVRRTLFALVFGAFVSGIVGFFTIPLVWFRKMSLMAAVFTGLQAIFKNLLAFALMLVGVVTLCIPLFMMLGLMVGFTAVAGGPGILQYVLFLVVVLAVQLLVYGTQYCAFTDIFHSDEDDADRPAIGPGDTPDDQFIA